MGGKTKTVFYIGAAGISLFITMLTTFFTIPQATLQGLKWFNLAVYAVAVVLSVATFIDYVSSFRKELASTKDKNVEDN